MDDEPLRRTEQLRLAHDAAMQMVSSQAGTFWSTITSMVAANTLIALGAAAIGQLQETWWPLAVGALFGLWICGIWYRMVRRQFAYFRYWIQFARDLQKELLTDVPQFLVLGDAYGKGSPVALPGGTDLRMPPAAAKRTIEQSVIAMIYVFTAVFAVLLIVAVVVAFRGSVGS